MTELSADHTPESFIDWDFARATAARLAGPGPKVTASEAAGVVADLWTVRGSIASGGFACVIGVTLTAAWLRDFWRYDARTDPYAVAERSARAGRTAPDDQG